MYIHFKAIFIVDSNSWMVFNASFSTVETPRYLFSESISIH